MPHLKCVTCRARLCSAASPAELAGERCPRCGAPLEPVGELAEVVGFQAVGRAAPERWPDDGDGFALEALAATLALPVEDRP